MRRYIYPAMVAMVFVLAACAPVGYGQKSPLGGVGYADSKIDDDTYEVKYDGNGITDKDTVWKYWIYRCAELTKSTGHQYFTLVQKSKPVANLQANSFSLAAFSKAGNDRFANAAGDSLHVPDSGVSANGGFIKVKGGGYTTSYIYLPGYTITTWHSKSIIRVFDEEPPEGVYFAINAQLVLDMLGEFTRSGGKKASLGREAILDRAQVRVNLSPLRGT